MGTKELPNGFRCECGKFHEFPSYVLAHWYDLIVHTCDNCGAKHQVVAGNALLLKPDHD